MSIDSSSVNIFLSLLQIIEKSTIFPKMYDILGFINYLYLPQTIQ